MLILPHPLHPTQYVHVMAEGSSVDDETWTHIYVNPSSQQPYTISDDSLQQLSKAGPLREKYTSLDKEATSLLFDNDGRLVKEDLLRQALFEGTYYSL